MEKFELSATNPDAKKEKIPLLKKAERFVRGKLLSLTMAGIILLGGPLERLKADQISFFKSDKEAYSTVLKAGIEQDAKKYLENLKKTKPEVYKWYENYLRGLNASFDKLLSETKNSRPGSQLDIYQEKQQYGQIDHLVNSELLEGISDEEKSKIKGVLVSRAQKGFDFDHDFLPLPGHTPRVIEDFKNDLPDILAYFIQLAGSESEQNLVDKSPASVNLQVHQPLAFLDAHKGQVSSGQTWLAENRERPQILLHPAVFHNKNKFYSVATHELIHALTKGTEDNTASDFFKKITKRSSVTPTPFVRFVFQEGMTENLSFEILQKLQENDPELKIAPALYGVEVISASFLMGLLNKKTINEYMNKKISDQDVLNAVDAKLTSLGADSESKKRVNQLLTNDPRLSNHPFLGGKKDAVKSNAFYGFELAYIVLNTANANAGMTKGEFIDRMIKQNRRFAKEESFQNDFTEFQMSKIAHDLSGIKEVLAQTGHN